MPIIRALEEYQRSNMSYPDTLSDLTPGFMDELPLTLQGDSFWYDIRRGHGYYLGFTNRDGYGCGYIAEYQRWECSPGVE